VNGEWLKQKAGKTQMVPYPFGFVPKTHDGYQGSDEELMQPN
jgi:hypothetical protein